MLRFSLFIGVSAGRGRGIFTDAPIPMNMVIEKAAVIVMNNADKVYLNKTLLHDYIFDWGDTKQQCAMALGNMPIFNHSYRSNCEYFMDYETETMIVKTVRNVAAGEELTINYNGDWNDETPVWFDVKPV